ncbi:MAG: UDP-2,3-diacylglucosamine diphosphatase [Phycisphaerales bacterium]
MQYRSVFISDTHLGFRAARTDELSAFLKHVRCERLYLVGDILDLWILKSKFRWPASHNRVVRRLLKHAKRGTQVVYIPGNHDDAARQYAGLDFAGVRIALQTVHRTADGLHMLVTHGDEYDMVVKHSRTLSMIGGWAYDRLITLNRAVNMARGVFGLKPWSFSDTIKRKVKGACTYVSDYRGHLLQDAARRKLDGVICGHVHQPAVERIPVAGVEGEGMLYCNCGDWIERCTALVEHADGKLEVIDVAKLLETLGIEVKRDEEEVVIDGAEDMLAAPGFSGAGGVL